MAAKTQRVEVTLETLLESIDLAENIAQKTLRIGAPRHAPEALE